MIRDGLRRSAICFAVMSDSGLCFCHTKNSPFGNRGELQFNMLLTNDQLMYLIVNLREPCAQRMQTEWLL